VGNSATSSMVFSTSELQPMVFVEGAPHRYIMGDDELLLSAVGTSAWCFPGGTDDEQLDYQWSMECVEGPCALAPLLAKAADSTHTRFLRVSPGQLPASCVFVLTCRTFQNSIKRSATDQVTVHVGVRPLEARISGVSNEGLVSSTQDTVISIADSWDPEEATTGLKASLGLQASWTVHEVREQEYCPLADIPLPDVGGVWDNCPPGAEVARPRLLYPIPGPVPAVALNSSMLKDGMRLQVTVVLSRDLRRLPPEIRTSAVNATGHIWKAADIEDKFGDSVQARVKFDVQPGAQLHVRLHSCDPTLIGQVCLSQMIKCMICLILVGRGALAAAAPPCAGSSSVGCSVQGRSWKRILLSGDACVEACREGCEGGSEQLPAPCIPSERNAVTGNGIGVASAFGCVGVLS